MSFRMALLASAAVELIASPATASHARRHEPAYTNQALLDEVRALRVEVDELRANQAEMKAQLQSAQAHAQPVAASSSTPDAAQQTATASPLTTDQVDRQVAAAIEREHHNDRFYFKGVSITPGGYVELAGLYREHFQGNDIASNFLIPFPNNRASHVEEGRFSARQSRLSLLAQASISERTHIGMYGEFDFLGAAQTANSVQSNSYNPRIRNLYGTIDTDRDGIGLHLLAGQSWSLVTLDAKGITPRTELAPPGIESQNMPGFYWARQPGIRLTADLLNHRLWIAASVENPQTTFAGAAPSNVTYNQTAGTGFDNANTLSLNHVPDIVAKAAYDMSWSGHAVHLEGFGLLRSFDEHLNGGANLGSTGFGFGGGIVAQIVPGLLDTRVSGITGKGIGRYGSVGLPDTTFSSDGRIHPIEEFMLLAGLTLHASKRIDLYGLAGEEVEEPNYYPVVNSVVYGVGNPLTDNSGCFIEGGTCAGNTHRVRQFTTGLWDKVYRGSFGLAQIGVQYSYTQRQLFYGVGGMPQTANSMGFLSFRYYPF